MKISPTRMDKWLFNGGINHLDYVRSLKKQNNGLLDVQVIYNLFGHLVAWGPK